MCELRVRGTNPVPTGNHALQALPATVLRWHHATQIGLSDLIEWNRATHDVSGCDHAPIDRRAAAHQNLTVRAIMSGDPRVRTEVQCPRATQAAMIAAAAFGLRRSGTFANGTSGAAYRAASVRHGPSRPLPTGASFLVALECWARRRWACRLCCFQLRPHILPVP